MALKSVKTLLAAAMALGVSVAVLPSASQAATACNALGVTPDVSGRVTGTGGSPTFSCEFEDTVPNSGNGAYDNLFFGGGFTEVNRVNDPGGTDGALKLTGDTKSGMWEILTGALTSTYDTFVLVFKAGADNTDPGEAVAYLVGNVLKGDYLTPLFKNTGNCSNNTTLDPVCERDISHVALLAKDSGGGVPGPDPVPLPAGLPLLLTGLLGVGILSRRRKA